MHVTYSGPTGTQQELLGLAASSSSGSLAKFYSLDGLDGNQTPMHCALITLHTQTPGSHQALPVFLFMFPCCLRGDEVGLRQTASSFFFFLFSSNIYFGPYLRLIEDLRYLASSCHPTLKTFQF